MAPASKGALLKIHYYRYYPFHDAGVVLVTICPSGLVVFRSGSSPIRSCIVYIMLILEGHPL